MTSEEFSRNFDKRTLISKTRLIMESHKLMTGISVILPRLESEIPICNNYLHL